VTPKKVYWRRIEWLAGVLWKVHGMDSRKGDRRDRDGNREEGSCRTRVCSGYLNIIRVPHRNGKASGMGNRDE
jgi:hypothetical protein